MNPRGVNSSTIRRLFVWGVGAFAAAGLGAAEVPKGVAAEKVVELPPLEVTAAINAPPWRYGEYPGVEVLSRCSTALTHEFMQAHHRLEEMFAFLVPREFQVKLAVPDIIVLADQKTTPTTSQDVVQGFAPAGTERVDAVRFLANLRLNDVDAVAVYAIVDERSFDAKALTLTPAHVRFVLERRTPPLPAWLIEGLVTLSVGIRYESDHLGLDPIDWIAGPEENGLMKDPEYPRTPLPMRELLERPRPIDPTGKSEVARRWLAQSTLFVRWALDGAEPRRRLAFWQFVARTGVGPATEAVFQECFALSYADVRDRLSDYLPGALKTTVRIDPGKIPVLREPDLRLATDAEIGRIKGDWERLEINHVKVLHPAYAARYEEQAKRTLDKARERAPQDVPLNTIIALRACDAGDDARARPLLEAALAAKVVRPRAYYELARIRYAEALAKPAGPNGLLSGAQANTVLLPLAEARLQSPPLALTYALAAEVWSHSDVQLSAPQLKLIDEGVELFPDNVGLLYFVAVVKLVQGHDASAATLIAHGLQLDMSAAVRARFEKLQATVTVRRPPAGR